VTVPASPEIVLTIRLLVHLLMTILSAEDFFGPEELGSIFVAQRQFLGAQLFRGIC
jgi:hypothetical protein